MNPKLNWKKINKYGGYVLITSCFLFIVIIAVRQTIYLWLFPCYTIAIPVEIYYDGHMNRQLVYKYTVNGKIYNRQEEFQGGDIGKKYYVKFSRRDPNVSDFLENRPVPDSIKIVPTNGWAKIPGDP